MYILGISAFYHDSAAVLLKDDEIVAAAQEERFTAVKHDKNFPSNAITYCLEYACIDLSEVSFVAFYDKPFLKFERLIQTYVENAPKGLDSFLKAIPVWVKDKLFLKKKISDELKQLSKKKLKYTFLFPEHHLSHAASAFYTSPYTSSAILTIDGVGEWATTTICFGDKNKINVLKELHFPDSIGLLYSSFTYFCGFKVNSGEYKLMGLAPYADPDSAEVKRLENLIETELCKIYPDGSVKLNQKYFSYSTGLKMINESAWENLFGFRKRQAESTLDIRYCNVALAIQKVLNKIVERLAKEAISLTQSENLCMAGGVALNCTANSHLLNTGIFKNIHIQPAAGDAGGALGAAFAAFYIYLEKDRPGPRENIMKGCLLGPSFSPKEIETDLKKLKAVYKKYDSTNELIKNVANLLREGKTVGWFSGRMEFGPRALGARSILADPRSIDMQSRLNLKVKFRESFRPFAPSVLQEYAAEYFDIKGVSPFMLYTFEVKNKIQYFNQKSNDLLEELKKSRSNIPAVTHVDYSARVQTVGTESNEKFRQLIQEFYKLTGIPVLINTSFNRRGEPIVSSPEKAYLCFISTELDYLVIEDFLLKREEQPIAEEFLTATTCLD